jgi:hypothetical protein
MNATKVGRWLEKQYIILKSGREGDEPSRSFLDPDGFATDTLYEAAFYEGQELATAAIAGAKHRGDWRASPLSFHLRDDRERLRED